MLLFENVQKHVEVCGEKECKIEIYDLNFPSKYTIFGIQISQDESW